MAPRDTVCVNLMSLTEHQVENQIGKMEEDESECLTDLSCLESSPKH